MTENKFIVVFDTNSYRNLVKGKSSTDISSIIQEIKIAESRKNIIVYGSIIVGMEMLGNIVEGEGGNNYNECLNGVIAMGYHCYNQTLNSPRIIAHSYLHIAKSMFGIEPIDIVNRVQDLTQVIYDFKNDYEKAIIYHNQNSTFNIIKEYIKIEETNFSSDIIDLISFVKKEILIKYPKISSKHLHNKMLDYIKNGLYGPAIVVKFINKVANTLNIQLSIDESIQKAISMNIEFPIFMDFYRWISYKIVQDNIDMLSKKSKKKKWNWLWDYEVTFAISNTKLDNREVILVTSEDDIPKMLKDFGYNNKVIDINQYIDFINGI